jgi:hypothetical protein
MSYWSWLARTAKSFATSIEGDVKIMDFDEREKKF